MGLNRQIVLKILLKAKHKLPFNGDWLFVTETPPNHNVPTRDLVMEYLDRKKILLDLIIENENVIKLIYERALKYNNDIENISENLKKKAEIILRTTSFVSAIIFGVLTFLSTSKDMDIPSWIVSLISLFFILMVTHLISSLSQAIKVMTREELVLSSPQQVVFKNNEDIKDSKDNVVLIAYKNAISDIISNACNTHKLMRNNVNKVIIAQQSFVYGLFFFMLIIGFLFSASFFQAKHQPEPSFAKSFEIEDKLFEKLDAIAKREMRLKKQIKERITLIENFKIENEDLLKQITQINKILYQIEKTQNQVEKNPNNHKE